MKLFSEARAKRNARFQDELMNRHYVEVENIYRQMRGWKHDFRKHMQVLRVLAADGDSAKIVAYLDELDADLIRVDSVLHTGNVMVDAILNSKLALAKADGIAVTADAFVPTELTVSDIDLCVILGNLLDNAIEACPPKGSGEAFLRVYLDRMNDQLYLSVTNSVAGGVRRSGGRFLSTKTGAARGFGLDRVDRTVLRYGGWVNRQYEPGVFATEVLLPL